MADNALFELTKLPMIPTAELPLHGSIPFVAREGIVSLGSEKLEDLLKVLPEFLAAASQDPKKNKIYCLKTLKTVELSLDAKSLLKNLLIYAARAKESPYPFYPDCLKSLAEGGHKELASPLKALDPAQDPVCVAQEFQNDAATLFGPFFSVKRKVV